VDRVYVQDGRKRGGWFWVDNFVFEMGLSPYSFMVYCFLIRVADRGSEVASISLRKIERALGISRKKVVEALRELEERGMIIRKRRKSPKGNFYSNLYVLTSKEDWDKGVVSDGNHGGSRRKPGVVSSGNHGGVSRKPPPSYVGAESVDFQREDGRREAPIKNNKNQELYKYQESSSSSSNIEVDDDDETERILETLQNKWGEVIREMKLSRLTPYQVFFFLENSALDPKKTLRIIGEVDKKREVKNPVALLSSLLPLKGRKHAWLLHLSEEKKEEAEWKTTYEKKRKKIQELFGIELPQDPDTEESAELLLRQAGKKVAQTLKKEFPEEELKKIKEFFSPAGEENAEELLLDVILDRKGLSPLFSLYHE